MTTRRNITKIGEKIRVRGVIDSTFNVGTEQICVLVESGKTEE